MPATRSQTMPASSRRTIGAALGLVLVVAAAPFLRSASAAQPTTDATATIETTPVAASVPTVDPAVWVNPADPTKSLILAANKTDGLAVYDMTGAKTVQAGVTAPPKPPALGAVTGV
ncbi:MAG TPA: phytase, partial [Acidimicrobiia bacterium]|nr:phytase [Acidimicrobiia bacterium]